MIVLLIILIVATIGGVAAYVIMQYTGLSSPEGVTSSRLSPGWTADRRGGPLAERIADAPSGCLVAIIAVMVIWIVAWLVVLVLGLSVLTA